MQNAGKVTVPPLSPDTLEQLVNLLVQESGPLKIILFGSFARGEQTSNSDIDVLVVLKTLSNRLHEMVRLRRALAPIRMPIDVLVYSEDEVRERGTWPGTALNEALRDGLVLYGT
jgi:predicted nucleotidyltransferase